MEYPAAVLEAQKSDALVHIKIQQTSIYSPSILLQFLVSLLLLAQPLMQIPSLWGAGEGAEGWDRPWCHAGGALSSSVAFPGQERLQGPLGHLGQQGSSGSGVWDPFPPAQHGLVLFIL